MTDKISSEIHRLHLGNINMLMPAADFIEIAMGFYSKSPTHAKIADIADFNLANDYANKNSLFYAGQILFLNRPFSEKAVRRWPFSEACKQLHIKVGQYIHLLAEYPRIKERLVHEDCTIEIGRTGIGGYANPNANPFSGKDKEDIEATLREIFNLGGNYRKLRTRISPDKIIHTGNVLEGDPYLSTGFSINLTPAFKRALSQHFEDSAVESIIATLRTSRLLGQALEEIIINTSNNKKTIMYGDADFLPGNKRVVRIEMTETYKQNSPLLNASTQATRLEKAINHNINASRTVQEAAITILRHFDIDAAILAL